MPVMNTTISELESILSKSLEFENKKLLLSECLNEAWFSNMLGWLLDPKASHGYNTKFAKAFLGEIAKVRKTGKGKFAQRKSFMPQGSKTGLANVAVIREFFLSPGIEKKFKSKRGRRYCDLVMLDLDYQDSFILAIENKLFSSNQPYQLQEYHYAIENKYSSVHIRDYAYLTINGAKPQKYNVTFGEDNVDESKLYKNWVCISWVDHILPILEKLNSEDKKGTPEEVNHLIALLNWFKRLQQSVTKVDIIKYFQELLIEAATECLFERLKECNDGKTGEWMLDPHKPVISHTSCPKKKLAIALLPNLTITIQGKASKQKPLFEKIIVPFGTHPDQVFNLIDYSGKDIFNFHFTEPKKFLKKTAFVKKHKKLSFAQKKYIDIFRFAYEHVHELKVLMLYSQSAWNALDEEIKDEWKIKK